MMCRSLVQIDQRRNEVGTFYHGARRKADQTFVVASATTSAKSAREKCRLASVDQFEGVVLNDEICQKFAAHAIDVGARGRSVAAAEFDLDQLALSNVADT